MQNFADVVRCACSSWEGSVAPDWRRGRSSIAPLTIMPRFEIGGSSTTHTHNSNRWYYACKARRAWRKPLEFADTVNTEHSMVIASEIAPDSHTLFRIVVLFTWICTCHSCKLSLLACNDAPEPSVACAGQQRQNSSPLFHTLIPLAAPRMSQVVLMTFPTRFDADHLVPVHRIDGVKCR